MAKSPKFGASGKFPEGKLTEHDEGELTFGIGHKNGKVILSFGKEVAWIGMGPDLALDLAELLIEHAEQCEAEKPKPPKPRPPSA